MAIAGSYDRCQRVWVGPDARAPRFYVEITHSLSTTNRAQSPQLGIFCCRVTPPLSTDEKPLTGHGESSPPSGDQTVVVGLAGEGVRHVRDQLQLILGRHFDIHLQRGLQVRVP